MVMEAVMSLRDRDRAAYLLLEQLWRQYEEGAGSAEAFGKSQFVQEIRKALPLIKEVPHKEKRTLLGWLVLGKDDKRGR